MSRGDRRILDMGYPLILFVLYRREGAKTRYLSCFVESPMGILEKAIALDRAKAE
jgi:hypothetical protein